MKSEMRDGHIALYSSNLDIGYGKGEGGGGVSSKQRKGKRRDEDA